MTTTIQRGNNFAKLPIILLALLSLYSAGIFAQANSIKTGVIFNWADTQTTFDDPATLSSISINGSEYASFVVPTSYELTRLGPAGHGANNIRRDGTELVTGSGGANWANDAILAYQSLDLNYYFESYQNGDQFCDNQSKVATTDAQIQTITYSPGIPSNPEGVLAVTERAGNNCLYVELYGIPVGGGPNQLLGSTFVKNGSALSGSQPQAPPQGTSDYWSSGRNNDLNDEVIGIALFELSSLAPTGSTITSIRYLGATNDHGDGKFFLMQTYAQDDFFEPEFEEVFNGNVSTNDNIPNGSTYSLFGNIQPLNGTVVVNTDGTFTYTPDPGFSGIDTFEVQVCLPAPNQSVCDVSIVTLNVKSSVSIDDASANEGDNLTFTISTNNPSTESISFDITYTNNSTTNADYSGPSTVTLPANAASVTFDVLAINDDWVEATEQNFTVTISESSGVVTITDGEGTGTVTDTDIAYIVGGNFSVTEGGTMQYRLLLSTGNSSAGQQYVGIEDSYSIDFATEERPTSSNPATDGSDFNSFGTTVSFPANSPAGSEIVIPIPTTEDNLVEPTEEFSGVNSMNTAETVKYGGAVGLSRVSIDPDKSVLSIFDNDRDNDGDGIPDSVDKDDDNDGILDTDECAETTVGNDLAFEADDVYTGTPPGPGTPVSFKTGVDGISRYADGTLTPDGLNFIGWDRPGNTSVDWSEGQYIAFSNEDAHLETPAMVLQSPDGGGFGIFSTDGETISQNIPVTVGETYRIELWLGIMPTYHEVNKDTDGTPGIDADAGTVANYGGRIRIGAIAGASVPSGYTSLGDQMDNNGNPSTTVPYYEYDVLTDFPTTYTLADFPTNLPTFEPSGVYTSYPTIDPHWFRHTIEFVATQPVATIQLQSRSGWDTFVVDDMILVETTSACDTDGDGIIDSFDLDSDNDGCYDTVEAGHTDGDNDGILGNSPVSVDAQGRVTGQGGYTGVTGNEVVATQVTIVSPPQDQTAFEGSSVIFAVGAIATNTTSFNSGSPDYSGTGSSDSSSGLSSFSYQWQVNGIDISNGGIYSHANTSYLKISDVTGLNGNVYTVVVTHINNNCVLESRSATLTTVDPCDPIASGNPDTDGDGLSDQCDVDDDNDGIFDLDEGFVDCPDPTLNYISTNLAFAGNYALLINEIYEDVFYFEDQTFYNMDEIINIGFENPVLITEIRMVLDTNNSFMPNGAQYQVWGSPNGANQQAMTPVLNTPGVVTGNEVVFDLSSISGPSDYYIVRMIGDHLVSSVPRIREVEYDVQPCATYTDTDDDGTPDYLDLDSDNDGCFDTVEGGLADGDNDGILGNSPVAVDTDGRVTGHGGYTGATGNEIVATEVSINTPPANQESSNGSGATFTIDASAINTTTFSSGTPDYSNGTNSSAQLQYQWQENGSNLANGGNYSGTDTNTLTITDVTGLNGNTYTVIVTHLDNDCLQFSESADLVVIQDVSINDSSTVEGTNNTFTITATHSTDQDVVFNVSYANISTIDSDYSGPSTVTLLANTTSVSFDVAAIDDAILESTETHQVNITYNSGAPVNITDGTGLGTITDNDAPGAGDGISVADFNVNENVGTADFVVTYTGPTVAGAFTVDFDVTDGSAIDPDDYTVATAGTSVTFPAGTTSGTTQVVTINIVDDAIIEASEELNIALSNISNALIAIVDGNGNGNITDNDLNPTDGLDFVATNVEVTEGVGVTATFEVQLTGDFQDSFDVAFETVFDTATATDFDAQANNISFTGTNGEIQTIVVTILNDDIIEPTEGYFVNLLSTTNPLVTINTPQANGTILDDDLVAGIGIAFTDTNVIVTEGTDTFARFTVTLIGNISENVTVDYVTNDGTALDGSDYSIQSGTITFTPTVSSFDIDVPILDDTIIEPTEEFTVVLSNVVSNLGIGFVDGNTTNTATGTILDNDSDPSLGVQFDITSIDVNEDAGTVSLDVVLNADVQNEFTVEYHSTDGTATDAFDYTGVATGTQTLTFGGANSNTQTITIPIIDDIIIENTEDFNVILSNISTTLITILANDTATVNIIDNDGDEGWPEDMTVEACDTIPTAEDITSTSACPITVVLAETVDGDTDSCPIEYTITRTWTITDCVGNTREHVQVITIEDTVAPTFVEALPADMTVQCDSVPDADILTAIDSCEPNMIVDFVETITDSDSCPSDYIITRTWSVADCAGNTVSHTQTITVEDTIAPTFVEELPESMTVLCNEVPDAVTLTAVDNCDTAVGVDFTETITNDANCMNGYTVTRVWTTSDCAGNTVSHTQIITIQPTGPITASDYDEQVTILCGEEIPPAPELTFMGGCGNYDVVFNEVRQDATDGSEDFMLIRTWDVTDSCGNTASFEQIIFVFQPQLQEVTIDICVEDEAIDLINYIPEGFETNGTFEVLEGNVTLNGSLFDPINHLPGEYKIAYSSIGGDCKYYVDFTIVVNTDCVPCGRGEIEISEAVTANGDGINDYFEIRGVEFCQFTFDVQMFNRWGDKVYESKDYRNDWNGSSPSGSVGSSGTLPSGTYYYIISATDKELGITLEPFNGFIYLGTK